MVQVEKEKVDVVEPKKQIVQRDETEASKKAVTPAHIYPHVYTHTYIPVYT